MAASQTKKNPHAWPERVRVKRPQKRLEEIADVGAACQRMLACLLPAENPYSEMRCQLLDLREAGIALAVFNPQDRVIGDPAVIGDATNAAFSTFQLVTQES